MIEVGTTISVLCMNKPDTLLQTIQALHENLTEPYEVVLVDNGSTDETTIRITEAQKGKGWIVIRNETNLGLSVGTNQGLSAGKYDCLIHLDDDCLIQQKGWNQNMRNYFRFPEVGMVVPGINGEFLQHDGYVELRWALGMCWAIRKSIFDDIGGYDPQLYHQNECDMALRVRMSGYHLAGIGDFYAHHNDPGGIKSDIGAAREHLGCVQFRDKWCSYFRGPDWNYGTMPLYLMQHWPPDQEFLRKFGLANGIDLNPCPVDNGGPGTFQDTWNAIDAWAGVQKVDVAGTKYCIYRELRNDYAHWEQTNAYVEDRQRAIDRWAELTGEVYSGYKWVRNPLRPY